MASINSISMPISDEDVEDPSNHVQVRARRKRKKSGPRGRPNLTRKIIAKLLKWWPALLLVFATALLIYEAFKIGSAEIRNPPRPKKVATRSDNAKPQGNLNKLDPITRVAGGVRERRRRGKHPSHAVVGSEWFLDMIHQGPTKKEM